ncbi:MAG: ACP S-malonyltransferase [Planctomycetota bacterium]|nr:ACP S-malonyltransferase [Planctomycetota bacterium]
MPKNVFMFPGQGAQFTGMAKDLATHFAVARKVFDEAEEVAQMPIAKLCFEGPMEELSLTHNSQVALLTASVAALEVAREKGLAQPDYTLGLSLGEYTALYAAGVLSFADAVKLVKLRGAAMTEAAEEHPGSMTTLLGADESLAEEIVSKSSRFGVIGIANLNCPGQVVLSGQVAALENAEKLAAEARGVRFVRLKVSGAFHSPLMESAADKLRDALNEVEWHEPLCPVVQNVDHSPHTDVVSIRENLVLQLTGPVEFEKSLRLLLKKGVDTFYEIGPGKVLAGLLRRTERSRKPVTLGTVADMETLS